MRRGPVLPSPGVRAPLLKTLPEDADPIHGLPPCKTGPRGKGIRARG